MNIALYMLKIGFILYFLLFTHVFFMTIVLSLNTASDHTILNLLYVNETEQTQKVLNKTNKTQ